jgi:DNA polymerase III alpha subunit
VDAEENALRFGLQAIKGVGSVGAATAIKERAYGEFTSVEDFTARVPARACNSKAITALRSSGSFDIFGERDEWSGKEIAVGEKEHLNMVLTVADEMQKHAELIRSNIYTQDEVAQLDSGTQVIVGGEITKVETKTTKKGDPFANVTVVFEMNEWRVKLWQQQLRRFQHLLVEGKAIMVAGKKDEWNGFISVVADDVTDVESLAEVEAQCPPA